MSHHKVIFIINLYNRVYYLYSKLNIMLGELNTQQIEELLHKEVIGRLGIYAGNKTYVVPITFAYDGQYIYGHSKDGLKIKMMRENPSVCFEVDVMENMANWQSVIAWGEFEELKGMLNQREGMRILIERIAPMLTSETSHPSHGFQKKNNGDTKPTSAVVFRIKLREKTGRYERN